MGNKASGTNNNLSMEQRIIELEIENQKLKSDLSQTGGNLSDIALAKENLDYEYIVFSGGGIKGISYCGALQALDKLDILNKKMIKGFAGTSAGSISAAMLAIGYTVAELTDIMLKINTNDLVDGQTSYLREGLNFVQTYGLVPGAYVYDLLGKLIADKTGSADYTIEQLYSDKQIKLVIVSTDMNYAKSRYFYPGNPIEVDSKVSIRQAVRMSMGIPFMFEPILHNGSYMVDGGVLDDFPIHVFDGAYPGDLDAKNNLLKPNPKVLGLQLVSVPASKMDLTNLTTDIDNHRTDITSLLQYSTAFISAFMAENDRRELTAANSLRTIRIITPYYSMTTFSITESDKSILVDCGRVCAESFFGNIKI